MLVYLGGTCNGSTWREDFKKLLSPAISVYNPVVEKQAYDFSDNRDIKNDADFILYVLTPETRGFMSVANAVDMSNKKPDKLLFCYIENFHGMHFSEHNLGCMREIGRLIAENGGRTFSSLEDVAKFLNNEAQH